MRAFFLRSCVVTLLAGCGSDGAGSNGGPLNGPSCAENEFVLTGALDGQPVDYRGTLVSHAWIQGTDPSTLDVGFGGGGSLHTEWMSVVAEGDTTTVAGSVTFPASGPQSGQTIDAATGSMSKNDNLVQFELTELSIAVACITSPCPPQPVEGTVSGCVRWQKIQF